MRLFDVLERPNARDAVRDATMKWLSYAEIEKLGLGDRLAAVAKNPDKEIRNSVAQYLFFGSANLEGRSAGIAAAKALLADADSDVVRSAAFGLSQAAQHDRFFSACDLLGAAIVRADDKTDFVVLDASHTPCEAVLSEVLDYIDKKTLDPAKITHAVGSEYAGAVSATCNGGTSSGRGASISSFT